MSKPKKWKKHVDVIETHEPPFVITTTTWQIHQADISPAEPGVTQVKICEIDGQRTLLIEQFEERIALCEDEFEAVVQAGAQAFLQKWPK